MIWNIGDARNLFVRLQAKLGLHYVLLTTPKNSLENFTLTVVGMPQLPDFGKTDLKRNFSAEEDKL